MQECEGTRQLEVGREAVRLEMGKEADRGYRIGKSDS